MHTDFPPSRGTIFLHRFPFTRVSRFDMIMLAQVETDINPNHFLRLRPINTRDHRLDNSRCLGQITSSPGRQIHGEQRTEVCRPESRAFSSKTNSEDVRPCIGREHVLVTCFLAQHRRRETGKPDRGRASRWNKVSEQRGRGSRDEKCPSLQGQGMARPPTQLNEKLP